MTEENKNEAEEETEVIEKKIDKDTEEELRDYCLFTDDETFPWVPKVVRKSNMPRSEWPIFTLKGKVGSQFIKDEDDLAYKTDKKGLRTASGTAKWETLKSHIKGWKNVKDRKGREIKYMSGNNGLAKNLLDRFPPVLMTAIYEAILRQSTMTEGELTGLEL